MPEVVVDVIGGAIDFVGDTFEWVGDVVSGVVETVGDVIEGALKDPLGTIAMVAAAASGQWWAVPLVSGVNTAIKGGDLMDVFKSVATSVVAQNLAPYVGSKVNTALGTSVGTTAAKVIASGAASSTVAIVYGQDPLKAFLSGGIQAAVPAALGEIDKSTAGAFNKLPKTAKTVIASAVEAQLSGGDITATVMNGLLRNSEYVTKAFNDLGIKDSIGPDGKPTGVSKYTPATQAVLANILYNTASLAGTGGDASGVVEKALMQAGSKALGDLAGDQFNKLTGRVAEVYNSMTGQVDLISKSEASQKAVIDQFNGLKTKLDGENNKLTGLQTTAKSLVDQWNASDKTNQDLYNRTNAAIASYQDYAADLNTRYTNDYAPKFQTLESQLTALKVPYNKAIATYEVLDKEYNTLAADLKAQTDKVATEVVKTTVSGIDSKFNPAEYAKINNLDSSVDPYTHWLTTGQNKGLYTNFDSAKTAIEAKQDSLIQSVAKSMGLDVNQLTSKDVIALNQKIVDRYGNNIAALTNAKPSDITGNLTKEKFFADSAAAGFKGDTNATVYGQWNAPSELTLPPGLKLASKEDYLAGLAKQGIDGKGNIYSYVPDPAYKSDTFTRNADGNLIKLDTVYITEGSKGIESAYLKAVTLSKFDAAAAASKYQDEINAAKNLVDKAKATGNTNAITNTTLDAATKAETLKRDVTNIFNFNKTNGLPVDGPNTALFGDKLQAGGGAGVPVSTLGPLTNKYSLIGYGGTFQVKDLTNDRIYNILTVGNSTILRDAATNIEVTLTPDQAKALQGQIAGGKAKNLDTLPSAGDISKMATGLSATNGKTLAENTTTINNQINAGTTTLAEAKAMMVAAGYTNPTDAEAQQFVSNRNTEAQSKTAIETWANPKVTTAAEVEKYFKDIGFKATQAEINKYVGKINEEKSKADIATYTNPLLVTAEEVKAALKGIGITNPDPADVLKFVGQYNESLLQGKLNPEKANLQFNSLQYQIQQMAANQTGGLGSQLSSLEEKITKQMTANEAAGMTREQATQKAIDDVAKELNTTKTNLLSALGTTESNLTTKINNAVSSLEKTLLDKIATNEATGMTRDEATQKAVDQVAADLGTTRSDLLTKIGATESTLTTKIEDLAAETKTQISDVQKAILDQVAANEAAGMSRDEALTKAINDVAAQQQTDVATLLQTIGTTASDLNAKINESQSQTQAKIDAVQKSIMDQIAANEAAGMTRDQATQKAVTDVAANLNTTKADILATIGSNYTGPTAADATAIQNIITSGSGGTGTADLKYDYNGDGKVDGTDLGAIQGYIGGTGTGTGTGTGFTPGKGSIWDQPTGIYAQLAANQNLVNKQIADEAEKTRLAQKKAFEDAEVMDKERQRQTNFGQLVNMLGQADDLGGQKVTVNASPLTQINNVYDWSSIFGTPQQEKMFVTPYASGGTVDDLVKILKG
jgi:hypothetical protein